MTQLTIIPLCLVYESLFHKKICQLNLCHGNLEPDSDNILWTLLNCNSRKMTGLLSCLYNMYVKWPEWSRKTKRQVNQDLIRTLNIWNRLWNIMLFLYIFMEFRNTVNLDESCNCNWHVKVQPWIQKLGQSLEEYGPKFRIFS